MRKFTFLVSLLTLVALPLVSQAVNDECIDAIALPTVAEFCTNVGEFSNEDGTPSFPDYPACIDEEDQYRDVWFSFVAQATDASLSITGDVPLVPGGTILTPQFLIYSGDCDNLTEVGCVSPTIGFNSVSGIFTGLMPGETYYLNIGARLGRQGSFQICVNQFNSVPEPSGDCVTGVVLCDKSSFAVNFLSGDGNVDDDLGDLLCNEAACGSAGNGQVPESNSAWYKWTCDQAGTLAFTIDPLGGPNDDLDFLVYELPNGIDDCINKENIRCMLSGESQGNTDAENLPCLNETGLSLNDPDLQEECGCQPGNNNFGNAIDMVAGRSYALLIMNFSNSGDGFNISFSGTGTFVGPEASFTTDLGQACVGEVVTFTDNSQSLDPIDDFNWNFGPNAVPATANGPGPHQVFFDRPGNQTILLAVETNRGCLVTEIVNDLEIVCCSDHFDLAADVNDTQCPGDGTGAIDLTVASQFAPFSYNWDNGATTQDLSGLEPGDYTVTISDEATCEVVQTFTVGGPPAFTFDTLITMPTCDGGQDGSLTLVVNGGTPGYEFSFNNGPFTTSNTINNIPIGTYNVRLRDANGCTAEQDIFVNELVLALNPLVAAIQEPRCNGESNGRITVNINNGLGPYDYDFGSGFQPGSILDNIPGGTYLVTVRDANNCFGNFNFEVPDPPAIDAELMADDISCFGQRDGMISATVAGGRPDYTYAWSNGSADPLISGLDAGIYTLTITDQNGCPEIVDTFIIEPGEIFGELVEVIDNVCFGESNGAVILTASGGTPGFMYSVDGASFQTDSTLAGLAAGDYELVIMDSEGCLDTVAATIAEPGEFIIDPGRDLLLDLGFDTTLTAVSNYRPVQFSWGPDSVQCLNLDCSRVLVRPFNSTNFIVTGVNEAGCIATAEVLVRVVDNKPVYIPNVFSPNGDGVNDGFTLFAGPAVTAIETMQIFDRWGGLLFETDADFLPNEPGQGWDGTSEGRPVNGGVYVYRFQVRFVNGDLVDYAGDITVLR